MKTKIFLISLLILGVLLTGCRQLGINLGPASPDNDPPTAAVVPFGRPFDVKIGEEVQLPDDVVLAFMAVPNDSRCPVDVTCVWAGEAAVHGQLRRGAAPLGSFDLVISPGGSTLESEGASQSFGDYEVVILMLEPPAQEGVDLSEQYRATFQVNAQEN